MEAAVKKQSDENRLRADIAAAAVELLSAQCAVDRVRLQYSTQDIVSLSDPHALQRAIHSAEAVHQFFSQLKVKLQERVDNKNRKK